MEAILVAVVFIGLLGSSTLLVYRKSLETLNEEIKIGLLSVVQSAAEALDGDVHQTFSAETAVSDPAYLAQARLLESMRQATASTAVIVVDMQNDFCTPGGMLHRVGIDISGMQQVIASIAGTLAVARRAALPVIYFKMGYLPDLSDLGEGGSVNRTRHLALGVGKTIQAPDGRSSRILVREPIVGSGFARTNHEASLLTVQTALGWISDVAKLESALGK